MELKELSKLFSQHPARFAIEEKLQGSNKINLHLKGLIGSSLPLLTSAIETKKKTQLFILNDKEEAAYFYNDLCNLLGEDDVLFFPSSYKRSVQYEKTDHSNIILRADALNRLNSKDDQCIIVSFPEEIGRAHV